MKTRTNRRARMWVGPPQWTRITFCSFATPLAPVSSTVTPAYRQRQGISRMDLLGAYDSDEEQTLEPPTATAAGPAAQVQRALPSAAELLAADAGLAFVVAGQSYTGNKRSAPGTTAVQPAAPKSASSFAHSESCRTLCGAANWQAQRQKRRLPAIGVQPQRRCYHRSSGVGAWCSPHYCSVPWHAGETHRLDGAGVTP